jgi:hypothetical protein
VGTTPGLDALEKKEISGRLTELEVDSSWNIFVEGQLKIWNT